MKEAKQNMLLYRVAQLASWFVSVFLFRRKILRNEIKGKKGPFVIIANHQAALDFTNLIGATSRPMSFVVSSSFYNTLPVKGAMRRIGVIPKQQFQTNIHDLKRMKAVIEQGRILVLYPAGLMCEDGLSTPLPTGTYQFLKWIGADVYVARTSGTYFATPKWGKGVRPGRTYLDIYQLFSKEELETADMQTVKEMTDAALSFDAYREQEALGIRYKGGFNIEGLENVLYQCPHCGEEYTMRVVGQRTICCEACGFSHESDEYAFLHNSGSIGEELRYVSDWSRKIYEDLKAKIAQGLENHLSCTTAIHMIDEKKNKFVEVGRGEVSLTDSGFSLQGSIAGNPIDEQIPIATFCSLPFSPGRHFELQHGDVIYRCVPDDGRLVMKFINMVKIFYELNTAAHARL
ncbi:MAG: 1-acyl-sn-glycerol-3-phosphate acyltransferase [Clostridia bacterium]|nr:1-acyl-sn-glycerol-3-phosphate acyltransferase [Clostridia bacterium]